MSPRKVRLVAGLVRGLDVDRADAQLRFTSKAAARPVSKLLHSAMANASHNHKMSLDGLFVKAIMVNQGPTMKRWRARAFGRAAEIRKRTSHITIVLAKRDDKSEGVAAAVVEAAKPAKAAPEKEAPKKAAAPAAKEDKEASKKASEASKETERSETQSDDGAASKPKAKQD